MKTSRLLLITCACLISAVALNAATGSGNKGAKNRKNSMSNEERYELMRKYDANKDGFLNEEEKAAAKAGRNAELEEEHQKLIENFDSNRDGKIDERERRNAITEKRKKEKVRVSRESVLHRHDHDGDGQLNYDERVAYKKTQVSPSGRTRRSHQRESRPPENSN